MTNPNFDSIDDYQDVESHNAYKTLLDRGLDPDQALGIIQDKSRDNGRTPMQWTGRDQAGFTTGQPWLNLAPNYKEVNTQVPDPSQKIFTYYQKLIRLRKDYKVISQGDYQGIQLDHDRIFAYLRVYQGQKLLVLNHFYPGQANISLDPDLVDQSAKVLISNSGDRTLQEDFTMGPYESVAFLID